MADDIDDTDDTSPAEESPLASALEEAGHPTTTPEAAEDAKSLVQQFKSGKFREGEEGLLKDVESNAESAKAALREARQRLASMRISPREQQLAEAQAWLAPTRTGRFGDTLSNVTGAMRSNLAEQRALQTAQATGDLQLASQLYGIDEKTLSSKMALQQLHEKMWGPIVSKALQVEGREIAPAGKGQHLQLKVKDVGGGKKQEVVFDPSTGTETPKGEPFSDAPPADENLASKIANYEQPVPTGYALYRPNSSAPATLDRAYQINPALREDIFPTIQKTRNDFMAGGKDGQKKGSVNTAVNHLHTLDDAADALQNNDIKLLNKIANGLGLQTGGDAPAVYDGIKRMVGAELATAVSLTSGVGEREHAADTVSRDFAGHVTHAMTNAYRKMLSGRMQTLYGQYQAGMGLAAFDEGTPAYEKHKSLIDKEFFTGLAPRTIYETSKVIHPGIDAAVADYKANVGQHPELKQAFKNTFHFLPEEIE